MSLRLLQVVHGFPPRENAGTEQYAARVAAGLRARGWVVHTLAATQAPGEPMYRVIEEDGVTRVVNNAPFAGLRTGGSDPAMDARFAELARHFRPDVVHLQHVASLSTTLPRVAPTVWTLHDAWAWCPAGGQLLRRDLPGASPCAGPGPACPACASAVARDGPAVTAALATAGRLAPLVSPDRLHRAWKRLPAALRDRVARAPAAPVTEAHVAGWRARHLALARRCALVSPSRWLADAAVAQGLPAPEVLPHGVDPSPLPRAAGPDAPFVFLGTLAPHKGPHLVVEAHRRAAAGHPPDPDRRGVLAPLEVYGPPGPDATYTSALPHRGPLPAAAVPALLARARALVLGSTWPENAPLVVLEARAAGCPVIAPAIGGLPELVVPGRDGWLYAPGDVDALAACLRAASVTSPPVCPPPTFGAHLDALTRVYDRARKEVT